MEPGSLAQNPFALLSSIAAPALLTNSSSVLALSTTNRMLRTRELMRDLLNKSAHPDISAADSALILSQVARVEAQSSLLLAALHGIYLAMGSFAGATLLTLIGATVASYFRVVWIGFAGIALGSWGVACLIYGTIRLFQATQLSLLNIREEGKLIRSRFPAPAPVADDTDDDV